MTRLTIATPNVHSHRHHEGSGQFFEDQGPREIHAPNRGMQHDPHVTRNTFIDIEHFKLIGVPTFYFVQSQPFCQKKLTSNSSPNGVRSSTNGPQSIPATRWAEKPLD
ncbi:MAG: hypothetical protein M2R45_04324 [Verrucomicrobia subdivision 3 bacterium]|nr:hypothetical protein [Limisphaerales bacterium]